MKKFTKQKLFYTALRLLSQQPRMYLVFIKKSLLLIFCCTVKNVCPKN